MRGSCVGFSASRCVGCGRGSCAGFSASRCVGRGRESCAGFSASRCVGCGRGAVLDSTHADSRATHRGSGLLGCFEAE